MIFVYTENINTEEYDTWLKENAGVEDKDWKWEVKIKSNGSIKRLIGVRIVNHETATMFKLKYGI